MLLQDPSKQTVEIEFISCPGCEMKEFGLVTETMDYDYRTTDMNFQIVRCNHCNLIYMNPRPKLSEIHKIYPPNYSAYEFSNIKNRIIRNARNFMQRKKAFRILDAVPPSHSVPRIIDVGCGSPALLNLLDSASFRKLELYGNDFNARALEMIESAGFKAIPGAFEKVDFERNFFDLIIMNQVIEHLFDVPGILKKCFQLLKPNGILYIETPSEDGLDAKLFQRRNWGGYHVPRHLQIFNARTIGETLSRYGFKIEKTEYIPSPNFWTSSIRNQLIRMRAPSFITSRMNYKNILFMTLFTIVDSITGFFHATSNMRVIARKNTLGNSV
jgi:2-polyprenyl-3-methyl-5-hydroxy-6-metoxy-1,4-benzoquinol methylase